MGLGESPSQRHENLTWLNSNVSKHVVLPRAKARVAKIGNLENKATTNECLHQIPVPTTRKVVHEEKTRGINDHHQQDKGVSFSEYARIVSIKSEGSSMVGSTTVVKSATSIFTLAIVFLEVSLSFDFCNGCSLDHSSKFGSTCTDKRDVKFLNASFLHFITRPCALSCNGHGAGSSFKSTSSI